MLLPGGFTLAVRSVRRQCGLVRGVPNAQQQAELPAELPRRLVFCVLGTEDTAVVELGRILALVGQLQHRE